MKEHPQIALLDPLEIWDLYRTDRDKFHAVALYRWMEQVPGSHTFAAGMDRIGEVQGQGCAICDAVSPPLVIDHCHLSGWVRGVLCTSCNVGEGVGASMVPDSYRWCPPAATAGVLIAYSPPAEPVASRSDHRAAAVAIGSLIRGGNR